MEAIFDQIVRATGWAILHSLWQGAIIYGVLYLVIQPVFKFKASTRYTIATMGGLLMLGSFLYTFTELFQWSVVSSEASAQSYWKQLPGLVPPAVPLTAVEYIEMLFPWLVLLYSVGLIIQSVIFWKGYRKIQNLKNAVHQSVPKDWMIKLETLRTELGIGRKIGYYLSDKIQVPLVIGYIKPIILFPAMLATQLEMNQLEAIMIHELSHIRRNDYLFNLLRTLTETILFFNPFAWLIGKMMDIERENACDDKVIQLTNAPLTYAKALLQLELLTNTQKPVLALAATGEEQHLYQRIKRITNMKTESINSRQKLLSIALTFATLISLAWVNPANGEKRQQNSPAVVKKVNQPKKRVSTPASDTLIYSSGKRVYVLDKSRDTIPGLQEININIPPIPPVPPLPPMSEMPATPPLPPLPPDSLVLNEIVSLSGKLANEVLRLQSDKSHDRAEISRLHSRIKQSGEELKNKMNSPEQKAKWEKYGKDVEAAYNSPEQKAKWEKYGKDMEAAYNSPEQKAKWEKFRKDMEKTALNSKETARIVKAAQEQAMELRKALEQQQVKVEFWSK